MCASARNEKRRGAAFAKTQFSWGNRPKIFRRREGAGRGRLRLFVADCRYMSIICFENGRIFLDISRFSHYSGASFETTFFDGPKRKLLKTDNDDVRTRTERKVPMRFHLTPEQVPEDLRWLCELVGMERFLQIIDNCGGEFLYFPKRETLEMPLRRAAILRDFDGSNLRQLARKYGITERRIRGILQEEGRGLRA